MGLAARACSHLNGEEMGAGGLYLRPCQALHRVVQSALRGTPSEQKMTQMINV
jgi:hypothetical protein